MSTPYYTDDMVTLYHGDCAEILPTLDTDPDSVTLTDPPYGIGVQYGSAFDDSRADYWPWMRSVIAEMRRISPVVAFTHRVAALREITDWDWCGVWNKPLSFGVRLGNSPLLPHWEPIFMYGIHAIGTDSQFSADVFTINPERVSGTKGNRGRASWASGNDEIPHPTPKPEGLFNLLLASVGQKASTVIDPFAGSGTTLRVAKDHRRRAIGIEIEEAHCERIAKRLDQGVLDFGEVVA